jgi:hypothetical protein
VSNQLDAEIRKQIKKHERWRNFDFVCAHIQFWIAILASFAAGILAAIDLPDKWGYKVLKIAVPAVPGFIILTEKTFNFVRRSSWHALYVVRLTALHRAMRDLGAPVADVSRSLCELEEEMENRWPQLSAETLPEPSKARGSKPKKKGQSPPPTASANAGHQPSDKPHQAVESRVPPWR